MWFGSSAQYVEIILAVTADGKKALRCRQCERVNEFKRDTAQRCDGCGALLGYVGNPESEITERNYTALFNEAMKVAAK